MLHLGRHCLPSLLRHIPRPAQGSRLWLAALSLTLGSAWLQNSPCRGEVVAGFEEVALNSEGVFIGPTANATEVDGPFGSEQVGTFDVGGVEFFNSYLPSFSSWRGFAVSNQTDNTTPGFGNQYSAFTGGGAAGSSQYGIAYGYHDLDATVFGYNTDPFDASNVDHLRDLPSVYLPSGARAASMAVTNTTYAALSMQEGDQFTKKFGGDSGTDPDFFKLSVFGIDGSGVPMAEQIEFYLADYRFADSQQDYILDEWATLDLTPLAGAESLHFNLTSSDRTANNGMNTPSYFAVDNLTITAIPEPSAAAFVSLLAVGGLLARRRR